MSSITLEDAVSLDADTFFGDFKGDMFNVWGALERWNNYEVEKKYRCHKYAFGEYYNVAYEMVSDMKPAEIFMFFCFVLLSEDRWPFADEN